MKRCIAAAFALLLMLCVCALPVSANAPGPLEFGEPAPVNPLVIALFLVISVPGVALTVVVEWLICKPFGIGRQYKKLVVWTNLTTQIILRMLQLFTFPLRPNGMSASVWGVIYLTVLELFVYLSEFLIYNWRIRDVSWKKCLYYTVTANTASLIAGLLVLFILSVGVLL